MQKFNREITLDKYINEALYDKTYGYYSTRNPFGEKGDYITSPNISVLFSEVITIWSILFWESLKLPKKFNIIELGAGNGEMMYQIMITSKNFKKFNSTTKFYIYEKSEYLRNVQKNKLKGFNVKWIKNFSDLKKGYNLFIGNEFLDAFAVKQFKKIKNNWFEKHVCEINKNDRQERYKKTNILDLKKKINIDLFKNQNFIEISIEQISFLNDLSKLIKKNNGGLLFFDYGYTNNKMINSLQSVRKHKSSNYLTNKGKNDITHLINFCFLKKILEKNGLKINGPTNQGDFLKKLGILERGEIMSKNKTFLEKADIFYRINRLINKNEMGNLIKVLLVTKKISNFNLGFK